MKDSKYYKKILKKKDSNKSWLSKILICIILLLLTLIITNFSKELRDSFVKNIYEKNINFAKISRIYDKYIGRNEEKNDEVLVSSEGNIFSYEKEEYNGSYKIKVNQEYPVSALNSGIIVYIGDKDEFNNTIIVQGNDGVDIWYSNILMTEYSLYDYVKKNSVLGTSTNDEVIITFMRDGKKISYEEYYK